jgi:hypothetical protein
MSMFTQAARNIAVLIDDPRSEQFGVLKLKQVAYGIDPSMQFHEENKRALLDVLIAQTNCFATEAQVVANRSRGFDQITSFQVVRPTKESVPPPKVACAQTDRWQSPEHTKKEQPRFGLID